MNQILDKIKSFNDIVSNCPWILLQKKILSPHFLLHPTIVYFDYVVVKIFAQILNEIEQLQLKPYNYGWYLLKLSLNFVSQLFYYFRGIGASKTFIEICNFEAGFILCFKYRFYAHEFGALKRYLLHLLRLSVPNILSLW